LVLINVKHEELAHFKAIVPNVISYNNLLEIKTVPCDAVIIIEDVINLSKKEETILRYYLNEYAHHKTLKLFCVGHTLFKTSLYGIIALFNFIIFTSSSSNVPLLKQALRYFTLSKEEVNDYLALFASVNRQGLYYFLDCQTVSFSAFCVDLEKSVDGNIPHKRNKNLKKDKTSADSHNSFKEGSSVAGRLPSVGGVLGEEQNKKFEKSFLDRGCALFEDHPSKHKARGILSIVARALPLKSLSDIDLTVSFSERNGYLKRKISLIDYIHNLLDPDSKSPEAEFKILHSYISSNCQIPKALILNKHFK